MSKPKQQNNPQLVDDSEEILTDQELQRAYMDARSEEEKSRQDAARVPEETEADIVDEALLDEAQDAIAEMEARERRRDSTYRSGGDDQSAGIDTDMDSNAPKELERSPNNRGKS